MRIVDRYRRWMSSATAGSELACSRPLYQASQIPPRVLGSLLRRPQWEQLNLFEGDDLLGWKLRPEADTWQWHFDTRARYTTDAEARRVVPGAHPAASPLLYFAGCSFTFGYCVSDDESFAARTAASFRVENWAVPGYGPGHHHLLMTRRGLLDRAARAGATIVYFFNPIHLHRVWRRRSWLVNQERQITAGSRYLGNPLHEIEAGALVYRGLARIKDAVDDAAPIVEPMEWRILGAMIDEMQAASRAAGVRFMVALLPQLTEVPKVQLEAMDRLRARLDRGSVEHVDLRAANGAPEPRATFPFAPYPTPLGHRVLAERLVAALAGRFPG